MEMNLVLAIGIIIVIGFLGGLVMEKIKFPRITGYIIIGILLSYNGERSSCLSHHKRTRRTSFNKICDF